MVGDSIDDPVRIAQLLASELTGLETGRLAAIDVADADSDVDPQPEGATAYTIEYQQTPVAAVVLYPDAAVVEFDDDHADATPYAIETGAGSKGAVDRLREYLSTLDDRE